MDRRTFIGTLTGSLLVAPHAARAQKSAVPMIGFLCLRLPRTMGGIRCRVSHGP